MTAALDGPSSIAHGPRRLRDSRSAVIGGIIVLTVAALAVLVPVVSPHAYDAIDWRAVEVAPAPLGPHPLGTDDVGRDLLVRTFYGARVSLLIGLAATIVCTGVGVVYGAVSGYVGGVVDQGMMRLVDVLYTLPFMFLVMVLMVVFGRNIVLLFVAIAAVEWLTMARIVRGQALMFARKEFVLAARASGCSAWRIIRRHIIPNCLPTAAVYATLTVPQVILTESFLSFLGLGVQEPLTSWGVLAAQGANAIESAPWLLVVPTFLLCLTLLGFALLGEGLRRQLSARDD